MQLLEKEPCLQWTFVCKKTYIGHTNEKLRKLHSGVPID